MRNPDHLWCKYFCCIFYSWRRWNNKDRIIKCKMCAVSEWIPWRAGHAEKSRRRHPLTFEGFHNPIGYTPYYRQVYIFRGQSLALARHKRLRSCLFGPDGQRKPVWCLAASIRADTRQTFARVAPYNTWLYGQALEQKLPDIPFAVEGVKKGGGGEGKGW